MEARDGDTLRVSLRGELDLATAPEVADRLHQLHARGERVLLDIEELAFMDATGIRLLLTAAEDAARDDRAFAVTPGSPEVRRLFELVHLDGALPIDWGAA